MTSPTCFEPRGFIPRKTGCICSMVCFTSISVSSLLGNSIISFFVGLCCIIIFRSLSSSIYAIASLPVPLLVFYTYFGFDTLLVFSQFLFVSLDNMYFHYYYYYCYQYYFGGGSSKSRSYRKFDASKPFRMELHCRHLNGTEIYYHKTTYPISQVGGRVLCTLESSLLRQQSGPI